MKTKMSNEDEVSDGGMNVSPALSHASDAPHTEVQVQNPDVGFHATRARGGVTVGSVTDVLTPLTNIEHRMTRKKNKFEDLQPPSEVPPKGHQASSSRSYSSQLSYIEFLFIS